MIVDGTRDSEDSEDRVNDDDDDVLAEMPASTTTAEASPCILAKASTEYLDAADPPTSGAEEMQVKHPHFRTTLISFV